MKRKFMAVPVFCLLLFFITRSNSEEEAFDVRKHLSTVTRYGMVKDVVNNGFNPSTIPDTCIPIHLNLVARHGTRAPTKKRMKELTNLSSHLKELLSAAEQNKVSLEKVPAWLRGWESPWKGKTRGGELIVKGEEELYELGIRIRERFPVLFNEEYHPDIYQLKATQVPRASASAVAFGMGLFGGRGTLGLGKQRAFSVTSESRASDILLRFFDSCENYKSYREREEPAVDKLKEPILDEITQAISKRLNLGFTRQDTSSLWFLCKQEALLLDITNQACALFTPDEIVLLEWTDDLGFFILKGYGKALNYRMGVPLLEDILHSMEQAIMAREENHPPGSYEKARLRFAHAETVVPFSCLLGLFLDGPGFQLIQKEQPLDFPPKPPHSRRWRGSIVAPFGGNNILVLYNCAGNSSSKYYVQVLHNEDAVSLPGCDGVDFCPFDVFKEKIVAPHSKHDYNAICKVKHIEQASVSSKFFGWLRLLFSPGSNDNTTEIRKVEL